MNTHRLQTSYKHILILSLPIMLGSAAQNVIALIDSTFLFHYNQTDFAAMGFVSVLYLVISAIGFSISRGGQILIARSIGAKQFTDVGRLFQTMFLFELLMAAVLFVLIQLFGEEIIALFIDTPILIEKCNIYLKCRSYGIFFSYLGVSIIALYTGYGRTKFIIIDTFILFTINIVLDYALIFGTMGAPELGIAGAGIASAIAEGVAFFAFLIYMLLDPKIKEFHLFSLMTISRTLIRRILRISNHMLLQTLVGLGSWLVFFGLVENMGEKPLAISNLVRIVYLILSIPCWGLASGINTMVSQFVGSQKRMAVIPIIWKTTKMTLFMTLVLTIPTVLFPDYILYPLFGKEDMSIIYDSQPSLYVLLAILIMFSIGGIFFNGLIGTGATFLGLKYQTSATILYVAYCFLIVTFTDLDVHWVWAAEFIYWTWLFGLSLFALNHYRTRYKQKVLSKPT